MSKSWEWIDVFLRGPTTLDAFYDTMCGRERYSREDDTKDKEGLIRAWVARTLVITPGMESFSDDEWCAIHQPGVGAVLGAAEAAIAGYRWDQPIYFCAREDVAELISCAYHALCAGNMATGGRALAQKAVSMFTAVGLRMSLHYAPAWAFWRLAVPDVGRAFVGHKPLLVLCATVYWLRERRDSEDAVFFEGRAPETWEDPVGHPKRSGTQNSPHHGGRQSRSWDVDWARASHGCFRVLDYLMGQDTETHPGPYPRDLYNALDYTPTAMRKLLQRMNQAGVVSRWRGRYNITALGKDVYANRIKWPMDVEEARRWG